MVLTKKINQKSKPKLIPCTVIVRQTVARIMHTPVTLRGMIEYGLHSYKREGEGELSHTTGMSRTTRTVLLRERLRTPIA